MAIEGPNPRRHPRIHNAPYLTGNVWVGTLMPRSPSGMTIDEAVTLNIFRVTAYFSAV
jgi:hypothetical protein